MQVTSLNNRKAEGQMQTDRRKETTDGQEGCRRNVIAL